MNFDFPYSGGMKRRLSVAIALVGEPKIIFLDEPTTGLDPGNKSQLCDILMNLKGKRAMVVTTHSMEEADILCSRIGILILYFGYSYFYLFRNHHKWCFKMYRTSNKIKKFIWQWISFICQLS